MIFKLMLILKHVLVYIPWRTNLTGLIYILERKINNEKAYKMDRLVWQCVRETYANSE